MRASDNLFSELYSGPSFGMFPLVESFRKKVMDAVQLSVSMNQPISVVTNNKEDEKEYLKLSNTCSCSHFFTFTKDSHWVKYLHKVGDILYKVVPENNGKDSNNLLEIAKVLGFVESSANQIIIPNFSELLLYGMPA